VVNKDMTIAEVLQLNKGTALVLMNAGMHCVGCPSSSGETLEEASMVHGIEVDVLVNEINNFLQSV
jgi:hybrid cluster-associated redox disulfide protein